MLTSILASKQTSSAYERHRSRIGVVTFASPYPGEYTDGNLTYAIAEICLHGVRSDAIGEVCLHRLLPYEFFFFLACMKVRRSPTVLHSPDRPSQSGEHLRGGEREVGGVP